MVSEKSKMFFETSCELLRDGYPIRFCANGHSMKPTIKDGEIIIIEPVAITTIKRSDIILYRTKRGVIAHRVIDIKREAGEPASFILRGDWAASSDSPVAASEILGRVVAVERKGRRFNLASRNAKRLAGIKIFLYKLRARAASTIKPILKF